MKIKISLTWTWSAQRVIVTGALCPQMKRMSGCTHADATDSIGILRAIWETPIRRDGGRITCLTDKLHDCLGKSTKGIAEKVDWMSQEVLEGSLRMINFFLGLGKGKFWQIAMSATMAS